MLEWSMEYNVIIRMEMELLVVKSENSVDFGFLVLLELCQIICDVQGVNE